MANLEYLLGEALKGKGLQKIEQVLEEDALPVQKCSRLLMGKLDKLVNKELDKNDFKNVSLLLKCVQCFSRNDSSDGFVWLLQQGLVAKMTMWFERVTEFLKSLDLLVDKSLPRLAEDFYCTVQVVCSNSSEGKKQLIDSFFLRLGLVITEKKIPVSVRLEAARALNRFLEKISHAERKKMILSEELCNLMQDLAQTIPEVGDYETQVAISEALCRISVKKWRDEAAQRWFVKDRIAAAFKCITDEEFETDCRKFLNEMNESLGDKRKVYSYPCITAYLDMDEVTKPADEKLECFWIDFNLESFSISFFINDADEALWDAVSLEKELVHGFNVEENETQKVFIALLKNPVCLGKKQRTKVKIYFEPQYNIMDVAKMVYGEEKIMLLLTDVPPLLKTLTETDSNASECTKSSTINELEQKEDEHSCAEDNQTETTEEIVNIENNQAKAVSPTQDAEKSMHALSPAQSVAPASVTKPQLNDDDMDSVSDMFASHFSSTTPVASTGTSTSQSTVKAAKNTEKGTESVTEPHDSLSTQTAETDVDNSKKEDLEEVSHSQNLEPSVNYVKDQTPTELRSDSEKNVRKKRKRDEFELDSATSPEHSESVRQAKTKVFGEKLQSERSLTRTSVKVKPRSSERTKQSRSSKKHLFSESSNEASSGSEKSWISENQKKTSSRILDYSRSKPKPKSKLKVLPLSSGNSTDEEKSSKLVASDSIQKTIKNSFNSELDIRSLTPIKRVKSSTSPTKSEKEPSDIRDLASPATLCDEDKISSENAPQNDLADILSITASPLQATTLVEDVTVILQEQTHESTPVNLDDEPVNISTLEFGLQKRKAFGSQEDIGVPSTSTPLPGLKPRKLFASSEKKQKSAEDTPDKVAEETAFYDDLHSFDDDAELSDASIITAFSNFSEQLKKTFLSRHKKMEIHMQNCMKDSQQHVTTLLTELHNCRLQKLDNFQNTVTQELANLEKDAQRLMQLEKTTLDFWKTQTLNVRTFCIQQQQRLKSMTSLLGEPFRSATDMLPQTKAKEGENMPQNSAN